MSTANPLILYGSLPVANVYGGAKRGISLASGPFFWEATQAGIHPQKSK